MPLAATIDVSVEDDRWVAACPDAKTLIAAAAEAALAAAPRTDRRTVIGVVLADDSEQRRLNHTYRGRDEPTNVLSFALTEADDASPEGEPLLLGDVVLAYETVAREAAEQQKPLPDHLCHLVVHGVLHLLGFDHEDDADAQIMEACEVEILARLGVPDPYRDIM